MSESLKVWLRLKDKNPPDENGMKGIDNMIPIEGYFPVNVEIVQKTVYDRGLVWAKTNCRSDMSGNLSFKFRA